MQEGVIESWDEEIFRLLGYEYIPTKDRADGSVLIKYKRSK